MTTFYGARSEHCPLALPCQIDLSDENLKYTTIVSETKDLLMTRGVSVQGSLCPGGLCPGGLCPGVSVQGVSVQESLCPAGVSDRGSLSGGLCPGVSLHRRSLSRAGLCPEVGGSLYGDLSRNQKSGRYASYWNVFLLYR